MRKRRKLDMIRNKKLLKEAATKLFAENGFHATKIDDIVEIAGFSKGTFYNYFKSKEAVLLEIIDDNTEKLLSELSIISFKAIYII
ncbi:MAG: TetR/AcrR family transcriptional regulator [Candidatus Zixiibacteriota bacterium]